MKNVMDFGAAGDGKTLDTSAIQSAIDAGGIVYFPAGTYLTGTLYLKSNGGLFLAPGAKIMASTRREDYNESNFCLQNQIFKDEFMAGTHLIVAVEKENVSISGFGTIDGNSHHWVNDTLKQDYCDFYAHPPAEAERPAQMIFFAECKRVKVENVTLLHSPFWHLFFHGCTDVTASGLNIKGERRQWVNDGIDVDCCANVAISNCIIDTGDDGITLRANGRQLKEKDAVCENVVVTNCVITSYLDYGIRIGVGNGVIRNCMFSNLVIKDSLNGLGITCRFSPNGDCTSIENMCFSNISVEAKRALEFRISSVQAHPALKNSGYIKNVRLNNVFAKTNRCCYILGFENAVCSDIEFNNSSLEFVPENSGNDRYPCNYSDVEEQDCALFIYKAENIEFNNFKTDKKCLKYDIVRQ